MGNGSKIQFGLQNLNTELKVYGERRTDFEK